MRTDTSPPNEPTSEQDRKQRSHGQAVVEFSIILPVFFLLVAGMFDFGLGIYSDLTLVNAAREGARLGVIDPGNTSAIEARVRDMASNLDDSKLNVTVACERPTGGTFSACSDPSGCPAMPPGWSSTTSTRCSSRSSLARRSGSRPNRRCASSSAPPAHLPVRHGVPPRGSLTNAARTDSPTVLSTRTDLS